MPELNPREDAHHDVIPAPQIAPTSNAGWFILELVIAPFAFMAVSLSSEPGVKLLAITVGAVPFLKIV